MIHLDLQPELEAQLAAEAEATGLSIECLIQNFVTERLADHDLQQGLDDIAAGRTRPAREVFAELRQEYGIRG